MIRVETPVSGRARRWLAGLAVVAGIALLAHSVYLGVTHPGLLGRSALAAFVPGPQFLFGVVLLVSGWVGRSAEGVSILATLVVLGMLIVVTGPAAPASLGVVRWSVLATTVLLCVGIPGLVMVLLEASVGSSDRLPVG